MGVGQGRRFGVRAAGLRKKEREAGQLAGCALETAPRARFPWTVGQSWKESATGRLRTEQRELHRCAGRAQHRVERGRARPRRRRAHSQWLQRAGRGQCERRHVGVRFSAAAPCRAPPCVGPACESSAGPTASAGRHAAMTMRRRGSSVRRSRRDEGPAWRGHADGERTFKVPWGAADRDGGSCTAQPPCHSARVTSRTSVDRRLRGPARDADKTASFPSAPCYRTDGFGRSRRASHSAARCRMRARSSLSFAARFCSG